ncbi:PAQR family membrane homeostasis protein TrhA [Novipirellula aureliae]|uniref:PAQR family membrane homeostasis protein TrhA n=1 Tax=Novipirellula aureliae TaxID=2527966 RepID=UPI001E659821|nr:hemolysin III family protein [Novipirellula aureliae]
MSAITNPPMFNGGDAPVKWDQEWANAFTHGLAAIVSIVGLFFLVAKAGSVDVGLAIACTAYMSGVIGTFICSTLSHTILRQPLLDTLRAWDQAMIYVMISGTYTPIVYVCAADSVRIPLLVAIWIAAGVGFFHKVLARHRVNSIGTLSYLMLGWLPAIPLIGQVPGAVIAAMFLGGVLYSLGTILLVNDGRIRYLHAGWHISVMLAAAVHFFGIYLYLI